MKSSANVRRRGWKWYYLPSCTPPVAVLAFLSLGLHGHKNGRRRRVSAAPLGGHLPNAHGAERSVRRRDPADEPSIRRAVCSARDGRRWWPDRDTRARVVNSSTRLLTQRFGLLLILQNAYFLMFVCIPKHLHRSILFYLFYIIYLWNIDENFNLSIHVIHSTTN